MRNSRNAENLRDTKNARLLSVIAALVCAVLSLTIPSYAGAVSPSSLIDDTQRTATLRIEKSAGDPLTQFGDPSNPTAALTREPLQGIEFIARQVTGIDLSTAQGWQEAEALHEWQFYAGGDQESSLGEPRTAVTAADGVATFSDLPLGLYYVTENHATAQRQNLSLVAPFLIALPATNAQGTGWDYDVTVRAKDQLLAASKQADRRCAAVGDVVEYGISASLSAPDREGRIRHFSIADPLTAGQEFLTDTTSVFLSDVHRPDTTIRLESEDFTVHLDGDVATLSLTEKGLAKAADWRLGNPGVSVTWKFKVRLQEMIDPLYNRGYVIPPGYPQFDRESQPGVPTNQSIIRMPCTTPGTVTPIPVPVPDPHNPAPDNPSPSTLGKSAPHTVNTGSAGSVGSAGVGVSSAQQPSLRDRLPNTGASVLWLVGIAMLITAVGLFLMSRRKEEEA